MAKHFREKLTLGVSICLGVVSIETLDLDVVKEWVLTVKKISTASKSASWQSRNLGWDRDFSISSRHQCPDQKVSIEIKKFVEIWKFRRFSTVCLDLDQEVHGFLYFLVEISQSVETFHHFQTQKALTMSRFLDKSWLSLNKSRKSWRVSTNLDNLDASQQSRQKSWRVKVLTEKSRLKSLDFKNLDREKKKLISTWWTFLTVFKS